MSIIGMQKLTVKKIAQIGAVIACLGRGGTRTGEEKEKANFMCQLASLSLSQIQHYILFRKNISRMKEEDVFPL